MTIRLRSRLPEPRGASRSAARLVVALLTACTATGVAWSQAAEAPKPPRPVHAESGVQWQDLGAAQQQFLQPLQHDWAGLDSQQQRKWRELSSRAPKLSAEERQRIQARMTEWATLTPEQRGQARLRYEEAKQLPATDRQARWDSYQSLPPEKKQQLAAQAAAHAREPAHRAASAGAHTDRPGHEQPAAKSNIVPNPALSASPRPIGPTLLQARPGATTTPISRPATPPSHQQTGMPKIAATPEFVNRATLLPQRGPQAAATGMSIAVGPARSASTPLARPSAAAPAAAGSAPRP